MIRFIYRFLGALLLGRSIVTGRVVQNRARSKGMKGIGRLFR